MNPELEPLLAALRDPATYPDPATAIEHLETHISHVFLAGDYAYKLKKAVDFGFLDFTTLEKRRHACLEEVRLNQRLAPEWYLGVVPVCRGPEGHRIRLDGCSRTEQEAEPIVRMKRLPQDGLLDRLATAGRLEINLMDDIARQLAVFHAQAERGVEIERCGSVESIRAPAIQNFNQTRPYIGRVIEPERHRLLHDTTEAFLANHAKRFVSRQQAHCIVDGHGDLHLRNMCLAGDRVVIFDCIEFNPVLRAGDVMSDIAFLTMDLDHRALPAHGNRFLNEYLEQSGDYSGLPLLDFYQAYRACVRAKVSCFEAEQDAAIAREAAAYFALAERYFTPRTGGLLITCGLSGSGKSTLARDAARELNGIVVRSDAVRKHLAGLPLTQRGGDSLYTPAMTADTYAALRRHGRVIVESGRWTILDAVHGHRSERAAAAALAQELGVPFGILYCEAPPEELRQRLARRTAEGPNISDANVTVLEKQIGFFEMPVGSEGPVCHCTGGVLPAGWLASIGRN